MKGKDNPIKINDAFSQMVKQKLENHQVPVADDVWEGIEQQLTPQRKRRVAVWYLIAGGVRCRTGINAADFTRLLITNLIRSLQNKKTIQHTELNPKAVTSGNPVLLSESKPKAEKVHTIISPKSKIEAEQLSEKIKSFTQSLNSEKTSFRIKWIEYGN